MTLGQDLVITTSGLATLVPDDLADVYQGLVDGVGKIDPGDTAA